MTSQKHVAVYVLGWYVANSTPQSEQCLHGLHHTSSNLIQWQLWSSCHLRLHNVSSDYCAWFYCMFMFMVIWIPHFCCYIVIYSYFIFFVFTFLTKYISLAKCIDINLTLSNSKNYAHALRLIVCCQRKAQNTVKISNIMCIKSQNLNYSRHVLQLPLTNALKPGVKWRMMWLEQLWQAMLQLHLSDQQVYCLLRCNLY